MPGKPTTGTACIVRAYFNGGSSSYRIERDGASVLTASGNAGTNQLSGLNILNDFTNSTAWTEYIAKLDIIDGAVSASDETAMLEYLRNRYDIVTV